jgi:hypothetical protein
MSKRKLLSALQATCTAAGGLIRTRLKMRSIELVCCSGHVGKSVVPLEPQSAAGSAPERLQLGVQHCSHVLLDDHHNGHKMSIHAARVCGQVCLSAQLLHLVLQSSSASDAPVQTYNLLQGATVHWQAALQAISVEDCPLGLEPSAP